MLNQKDIFNELKSIKSPGTLKSGQRHLSGNYDLRLSVQTQAMPAIFLTRIAKKSASHYLSG